MRKDQECALVLPRLLHDILALSRHPVKQVNLSITVCVACDSFVVGEWSARRIDSREGEKSGREVSDRKGERRREIKGASVRLVSHVDPPFERKERGFALPFSLTFAEQSFHRKIITCFSLKHS